jgi:hypothetical protein
MASSLWAKIETWLKGFESEVDTFFTPLVAQFKTTIGPTILAAAEDVVADLGQAALGTLSGSALVSAVETLGKNLLKQGVTAAEPILTTAIQAAAAKAAAAAVPTATVDGVAVGTAS